MSPVSLAIYVQTQSQIDFTTKLMLFVSAILDFNAVISAVNNFNITVFLLQGVHALNISVFWLQGVRELDISVFWLQAVH